MNKNHRFMLKLVSGFLLRSRSRIYVATLGIAIGATVFMSMLVLSYDLPRQMSHAFRSYGANLLLLPEGQDDLRLSLQNAGQAVAGLPQDKLLGHTPFRYERMRSNMQPYMVAGTDFPELRKTKPYWQITGTWPESGNEILIGSEIAENTGFEPGRLLTLEGRNSTQQRYAKEFRIKGIVRTGELEDGFIFMPLTALEEMSGEKGLIDILEISIAADQNELNSHIKQIHENVPHVEARAVKKVTRSENMVSGKLEGLLYLVTIIVLILTMICVATTMMTMIMERRKEIGLKKAIGAGNRDIAAEFIAESVFMGLCGGLIGTVSGLFCAQIISSHVFSRSVEISFHLLPVTLFVSVLITILACLFPVRLALRVDPALVLKGE